MGWPWGGQKSLKNQKIVFWAPLRFLTDFWSPSEVILGSCLGHFGVIVGRFGGQFGSKFGGDVRVIARQFFVILKKKVE